MSLDASYIAEKSQLNKSDLNWFSLIEKPIEKKKKKHYLIQISDSVKILTSQNTPGIVPKERDL